MDNSSYQASLRAIDAIRRLHDETGRFFNERGYLPAPSSAAAKELQLFPQPQSVTITYDQSHMLVEVAADQLMALAKTLTEPALTISPWTCARSVLESAALAMWLIDPKVAITERIKRSFALRYEGLTQQLRVARLRPNQREIDASSRQIEIVKQSALELGFSILKNKKDESTGIAIPMPTVTEIVRDSLNEEVSYRLFSAVAHGHLWAIQQTSFKEVAEIHEEIVETGQRIPRKVALEKFVSSQSIITLCVLCARAFVHPVWFKCLLFGWDSDNLRSILDSVFDQLSVPPEFNRFWH